MKEEKLSTIQQDIITIELLWQSLMPDIPAPHRKFIITWLRYYTFEQISTTLEHIAQYCEHRNITNPEHVGKITSRHLRTKYGSDDNVRAIHFGARGCNVHRNT